MKPTIAIFIHDPQCETDCAIGMIQGLVSDFNVSTFGLDELSLDFLRDYDVVAFPGGMGDSDDFDQMFTQEHIAAVQTYVAEGGRYFGICMGAYWAGAYYFNLVTDLSIERYIDQPDATISIDWPTMARVFFDKYNEQYMYFYDGCAILGEDMDIVAVYDNGNAMAAIQDNVGMFGCHPEALSWWYEEGNMSTSLFKYSHAELMRNFVHTLLDK